MNKRIGQSDYCDFAGASLAFKRNLAETMTMIYIKYFGPLAAEVGTHAETLPWDEGGDTDTLLRILRGRNQRWQDALSDDKVFKLVVQKNICHSLTDIPDGAEVGILPPVTGG